jgi:hypothetical protein
MPDYTKATGSSGTMMIRDTGTNVEFWINANNGTTFNNQMPWAYFVNATYSGWLQHGYSAGSGWNLLGSWAVTVSQTVTFYLGNTGTSGLGGPTTFNQFIFRPTVPAATSTPVLSNIAPTSMDVSWTPNSDGGSAITGYEVGYDTTPTAPVTISAGTSPQAISGLDPGVLYYFWVRAQNAVGWGPWSAPGNAMTIAGARVKVGGVYVFGVPYVKVSGVWTLAQPWVRSGGVWGKTI